MVPDFTIKFESTADAEALSLKLQHLEISGIRPVETLQRMLSKELVGANDRLKYIRHQYASRRTLQASDYLFPK